MALATPSEMRSAKRRQIVRDMRDAYRLQQRFYKAAARLARKARKAR